MSDEGKTVEERASGMGWVPQDKFKGDPEKWVDAETFVQRGEQVMPILKHNNERLQSEIASLKGELGKVTSLFQASQEAVEELKKFNSEATRRVAEQARKDLLAELKQARESGDIEAEEGVRVELDKVNETLAEAADKPDDKRGAGDSGTNGTTVGAEAAKEFQTWLQGSGIDWWGKDKRRTNLALGIAEELRADPANANLKGAPFYDKVNEELNKMFATPSNASRVEGSRGGASSGSSGGKSYADLPAEAKAACDRQGKKLVGPGRAYKDETSWRKKYAELYFGQ